MFAWARRKDHAASLSVFGLLVVVSATWLLANADRPSLGVMADLVRCFFLGTTLGAVGYVAFQLTRRKSARGAAAFAGTLLVCYAALDAYAGGLLNHHLNAIDVSTGWDGVRTGAIPLRGAQLAFIGLFVVALTGFCWLLLAVLAHLPSLPRWERLSSPLLFGCIGVALLFAQFRHLFLAPTDPLSSVLEIHNVRSQELPARTGARFEFHPGRLYAEQVARLAALAKQPALGVTAARKPDIVLVHVESLRYDHFTPELFPKTQAYLGGCSEQARHFSTGNGTPNAVFSLVTGLSPGFFELARAGGIRPQSLRALRELGYQTHVWFPNDALVFQQLLSQVIGTDVEAHRFPDPQRERADQRLVSDFLAKPVRPEPRFDYVVLDSTHYDYSYPPEFEKYRPVASLGLKFDPMTGEGLDERGGAPLRVNEAGVKNRYKNSILFIDSLVASLLQHYQAHPERPTFLVVFGDHGEAFWDGNQTFGHSSELSEAQTHVPLLLCGPEALSIPNQVSSHADVLPTIFEWMGLQAPAPFMSGRPLQRYAGAGDFALTRMPVLPSYASPVYASFLPHLRVSYVQQGDAVTVLWASDEHGAPLPITPGARADVDSAIALALTGARLTRP